MQDDNPNKAYQHVAIFMQQPDEITLTVDQNPAVMEAYKDSQPGDKCEIEMHLTFKSRDDEGITFIVEAAVPEGYEINEDAEPNQNPQTAPLSPDVTMSPSAMLVQKVGQKPGSPIPTLTPP